MTVAPRADANHCFVCGVHNAIGLRLTFKVAGARCTGRYTSHPDHAGFDGVTHGGIMFSVLDDAMANWFFLQGARGYTAKAEIRYRAPMPIGATAEIDCQVIKHKGRLVQLTATAIDAASGTIYAESQASFMLEEYGALAPS